MVLRLDHQPAELQLREGKVAAGAQEHVDLAALFYSHLLPKAFASTVWSLRLSALVCFFASPKAARPIISRSLQL